MLESPALSFGYLDVIVLFTEVLPPLLLTQELLETSKKWFNQTVSKAGGNACLSARSEINLKIEE